MQVRFELHSRLGDNAVCGCALASRQLPSLQQVLMPVLQALLLVLKVWQANRKRQVDFALVYAVSLVLYLAQAVLYSDSGWDAVGQAHSSCKRICDVETREKERNQAVSGRFGSVYQTFGRKKNGELTALPTRWFAHKIAGTRPAAFPGRLQGPQN